MIIAQGTALVLGTNELGRDVARALAATDAFARVFTAGTMPPAVRDRHRDIDFLDRGAPRKIAAALGDLSPRCLIVLSLSESPVTPERNRRYDSLVASGIAAALRIWHERGGRLERLIVLSSTAVYGLARSSPLVFDDRCDGEGDRGTDDRLYDEAELDPRLEPVVVEMRPVPVHVGGLDALKGALEGAGAGARLPRRRPEVKRRTPRGKALAERRQIFTAGGDEPRSRGL